LHKTLLWACILVVLPSLLSPSIAHVSAGLSVASLEIEVSPSTVDLAVGETRNITITVTRSSLWNRRDVTLYALNLPQDVSISFTPKRARPPFKSIATIGVNAACKAGDFNVEIMAISKNELASATVTLHISANVKTVDIAAYWDSYCTNRTTAIDWGTIEPSSSKDVTIYLKNEGDVNVTLSLNTANWNPSIAYSHISLSWNYSAEKINPSGKIAVTLTLTVSPDTSGITSFSFDIIITGSG